MSVPVLYNQDGIIIFLLPANRVNMKAAGGCGLVMFRNGSYSFTLECVANEFAKRVVIKLFDKIGYKVVAHDTALQTNFILVDEKQKFEFTLKYGLLRKEDL